MSSTEVKRGQIRRDQFREYRVMAVRNGYAMIRRRGAMPSLRPLQQVAADLLVQSPALAEVK